MRRRAKVDETQPAIVEALRAVGAHVTSLAEVGSGCPDLLVGFQGKTVLFECKRNEKALLTKDQMRWASIWNGGPLFVVYTAEQALEAVNS